MMDERWTSRMGVEDDDDAERRHTSLDNLVCECMCVQPCTLGRDVGLTIRTLGFELLGSGDNINSHRPLNAHDM